MQKGDSECISVSSVSAFLCYGVAVRSLVKRVGSQEAKKDEH